MGRDKVSVEYRGVPMLWHTSRTLRAAGVSPVAGVGQRADRFDSGRFLDVIVPDAEGAPGPLGGLVAALRWSPHAAVVVLAVDLPEVRPATIRAMLMRWAAGDVDAVVAESADGVQPLCSVWDAGGSVESAAVRFGAGARGATGRGGSLRDFIARLDAGSRVARLHVSAEELHNVNSPADLR
jgi:molybdopterin-guanine dinucleotide biosynthesis protein A